MGKSLGVLFSNRRSAAFTQKGSTIEMKDLPLVLLILFLASLIHILIPGGYYIGMKRLSKKRPWNLNIQEGFEPKVTLIVATFNEAKVIEKKLDNIKELTYPGDKLDLIIVDSASTDGTAEVARNYLKKKDFPFKAHVLEELQRSGKTRALNNALEEASGTVIATSDADCTWTSQSFSNALKFLSDNSVGAVCGQEVLINPQESSATRTEFTNRQVFNFIRIGESKLQATIVFEGALALFKKSPLEKFDQDCDDSGSALNLVQKGYRTIMVPDAFFLNPSPGKWEVKVAKKTRRAQHLVGIWWRCVKLASNRKLKLNPWISTFNIFLYLLNPFLFGALIATVAWVFWNWPILLLVIPIVLVVPKLRETTALYCSNYIFLLYGIIMQALNRKQIVWKK